MKVLVTGGSGYIGSHTCVQLLQQGHEVVILDNLCNSKRSVLPVIERLGGKEATFIEGDIRNEALMTEILHDHAIEAVIHFAGLKAVGESVAKPLEYYDNNVTGTLKLVSAMRAAGVKNLSLAPPLPSTAISRKSRMSKASRPAPRKAPTAKAS